MIGHNYLTNDKIDYNEGDLIISMLSRLGKIPTGIETFVRALYTDTYIQKCPACGHVAS